MEESKRLTFEEKVAKAEKVTSKIWVLGTAVVCVFLAWMLIPILLVDWLAASNLPENAGMIGDMFGSVNAFFAGLAVMLLIYSIFQMNKSIKIQQHELSLQRQELSESREVLKEQADSQKEMIQAIQSLAQQTSYSTYVAAQTTLLRELNVEVDSGVSMIDLSTIENTIDIMRRRLTKISTQLAKGMDLDLEVKTE